MIMKKVKIASSAVTYAHFTGNRKGDIRSSESGFFKKYQTGNDLGSTKHKFVS